MTLHRSSSSTRLEASDSWSPAPAWVRWATVALATLILCSCTSSPLRGVVQAGDASAASRVTYRGQDPGSQSSSSSSSSAASSDARDIASVARRHLPSHLTPRQMARASEPLANCAPIACGCSGCGQDGAPGPSDEYLCDGGDFGSPAAVRTNAQIKGLEREDTIAHYDTVDGRTIVTPSNKICIYAPRFGVVRRVIDLHESTQALMPIRTLQQKGLVQLDEREATATRLAQFEPTIDRQRTPPSLLRERAKAGELEDPRRVAETLGSIAAYAELQVVSAGVIVGEERVRIARASLAAIEWSSAEAVQVAINEKQARAEVSVQSPGVIFHGDQPNNPRLRLIKLADRGVAQQGEEVEFTLRYDNVGDREIDKVVIVDHLTTRLAYVDDSQKSTREAKFSTEAAELGSLVVRWELSEPLKAGEGGVIQFRCRVR